MLFETTMTAPVFGLRRDMNRLFDDMITRTMPTNAWVPPVDVHENAQEIVLSLELPGVRPEDVELTADNGTLTVRGTKHMQRKEGDQDEYHLTERSYGSFIRTFRLPKGVDDSKITADFENGVLQIHVPKAALPQPKKIQIGNRNADRQVSAGTSGNTSSGTASNTTPQGQNTKRGTSQNTQSQHGSSQESQPGMAAQSGHAQQVPVEHAGSNASTSQSSHGSAKTQR